MYTNSSERKWKHNKIRTNKTHTQKYNTKTCTQLKTRKNSEKQNLIILYFINKKTKEKNKYSFRTFHFTFSNQKLISYLIGTCCALRVRRSQCKWTISVCVSFQRDETLSLITPRFQKVRIKLLKFWSNLIDCSQF